MADLGGATTVVYIHKLMEVKELEGNLLAGFPTTNEGLLKRKELVPVLKRACSYSMMIKKPPSGQNEEQIMEITGTTACTTDTSTNTVTTSLDDGIMKQVLISLSNTSTTQTLTGRDHKKEVLSSPEIVTTSGAAAATDSKLVPGTMLTCRTDQYPPVYMPLPKWVESVSERGYILSPDLFQSCNDTDDSAPVPSTKAKKEARRIARLRKIEEVKKTEQSQQRKARFLKRQKRFDEDDTDYPTPSVSNNNMATTTDEENNLHPSPLMSLPKKKVMWREEGNLLEFHVYSPVRVEPDREDTPVVNS